MLQSMLAHAYFVLLAFCRLPTRATGAGLYSQPAQ
jgi:hypothetical protein